MAVLYGHGDGGWSIFFIGRTHFRTFNRALRFGAGLLTYLWVIDGWVSSAILEDSQTMWPQLNRALATGMSALRGFLRAGIAKANE
jgi:hypothetical protein